LAASNPRFTDSGFATNADLLAASAAFAGRCVRAFTGGQEVPEDGRITT
jgi:hypothetical protein